MKTFWGWHDQQLRDGTIIWTAPSGERYVTHPGSGYLFPGLCTPTAAVTVPDGPTQTCGDRTTMMPKRKRTRERQRTADITAERAHNHQRRTTPGEHPVDDEYKHQYDINYGLRTEPDDPPF